MIPKRTIIVFTDLIKTHPLTEKDKSDLLQLIDQSQNSLESLSTAISQWCNDHALTTVLNTRYDQLFGSIHKGFGGKPTPPETAEQDCVELLRNAIQTSVPTPKPVVPPPQPSKDSKPTEQKS